VRYEVGPWFAAAPKIDNAGVETFPKDRTLDRLILGTVPSREQNEPTMKKALLVLAVLMLTSVVLTSCGSHASCPAYGKVNDVPAAKRV
jgi:hypothetical protein